MRDYKFEMERFSACWSEFAEDLADLAQMSESESESEPDDSSSDTESDVDEAEMTDDEEMEDDPYLALFRMPRALERSITFDEMSFDSYSPTGSASLEEQAGERFICVSWPPSTRAASRKAYSKREREAMADEVKKRANDLCMGKLLENFAQRQQHRYLSNATHKVAEQSPQAAQRRVRNRRAVCMTASAFNGCYARAQERLEEVLKDRLCFRRNSDSEGTMRKSSTVSIGEVARAFSSPEASDSAALIL